MPSVTIFRTCLQPHPSLKGVFVGGCVERGDGSSFRASAHAHSEGAWKGWICVRGALEGRGGEKLRDLPLMVHELAHIASNAGHTGKWRRAYTQLAEEYGLRKEVVLRELALYRKVLRKPCACGAHRYGTEAATFYAEDKDPVYRYHSWAECEPRLRKVGAK